MSSPIDLSYPPILDLFPQYIDPKRTESASFLIWYLENYLRLDPLEAVDSVCDQPNDKGIDGIYVNEGPGVIEVYQSKISQKKKSSVGDTMLKEFEGTLKQLSSAESIKALIKSAGKADVGRLLERLDIATKIQQYAVKGVFVTNLDLDANGEDYLKAHSNIRFVGKTELIDSHISGERDVRITKAVSFDVSGYEVAEYQADKDHRAIMAPLKAIELIKLQGIRNQSLFAYNVRGALGRTQVNRDIAASIQSPALHKLFPLFHNGITIIADRITTTLDKIKINDYYVVNGCQSLSELFENSGYITGDLRILVKIVKAAANSQLAGNITTWSNNQNGVKPRDFKSNNRIQIRLQNEFKTQFGKEFFYEIKRGEDSHGHTAISNEQAGLYLLAFDLKQPWATHRKYQVFEDQYVEIFARPEVTAARIVLCHLFAEPIDDAIESLTNTLFAKYALTRYLLLYILRQIFESDEVGKQLLQKPEDFVIEGKNRRSLLKSVGTILKDIVIDLNAEIEKLGEDFDYRGKLRDERWVTDLAAEIVSNYKKLVARGRIDSLAKEFKENKGAGKVVKKR